MLPAYADEPSADLSLKRHLAGCEGCSDELARYQAMTQGLGALMDRVVEPPADLLPALLEIPDADNAVAAVKTHVARNRRAYLGGAAVVVVGAAGAALWRSRRRLAPA
jgi:hypothetical protein